MGARTIAIFNQKGGVGKTTTAMNVSGYLAMLGKRTLLVDLDPQSNATVGLGVMHGKDETVYHALLAGKDIHEVVKRTHLSGLDLLPSSPDLSGALVELIEVPDRERLLRRLLDNVRAHYDFIFIDLGPSLNLLTVNGLLAADEVIIPIQCEYYSLEGLGQVIETLSLIRENLGHPLTIRGALLTMYDKREKLSREMAREIRKRFPYHVYDVEIPRSVALAEASSVQKPVMLYAPQSPGAVAYERLAREIMGAPATVADVPAWSIPIEEVGKKKESERSADYGTYILKEEEEEEKPFILFVHKESSEGY